MELFGIGETLSTVVDLGVADFFSSTLLGVVACFGCSAAVEVADFIGVLSDSIGCFAATGGFDGGGTVLFGVVAAFEISAALLSTEFTRFSFGFVGVDATAGAGAAFAGDACEVGTCFGGLDVTVAVGVGWAA